MRNMKFFRPLANGTIQVGRIAISKQGAGIHHGGGWHRNRIITPQDAVRIAHSKGYFTRKELGKDTFVGRKIVE